MTILQFMGEHPILSFFIAYLSVEGAVRIGSRGFRSINILARGWPPAHLDADGDWKPDPNQ